MNTNVMVRPVVGTDRKWTVQVNGKLEGWVHLSLIDERYVALTVGKVLGRFDHKQNAIDAIRESVVL